MLHVIKNTCIVLYVTDIVIFLGCSVRCHLRIILVSYTSTFENILEFSRPSNNRTFLAQPPDVPTCTYKSYKMDAMARWRVDRYITELEACTTSNPLPSARVPIRRDSSSFERCHGSLLVHWTCNCLRIR